MKASLPSLRSCKKKPLTDSPSTLTAVRKPVGASLRTQAETEKLCLASTTGPHVHKLGQAIEFGSARADHPPGPGRAAGELVPLTDHGIEAGRREGAPAAASAGSFTKANRRVSSRNWR